MSPGQWDGVRELSSDPASSPLPAGGIQNRAQALALPGAFELPSEQPGLGAGLTSWAAYEGHSQGNIFQIPLQ